ncbi:MAG: hypothetical protein ACYCUG_11790 [Acidimicrobiales bacterium]
MGVSLAIVAIGAILDFAVTVQSRNVNWNKVGLILMIVGGLGFVIALFLTVMMNGRRGYQREQRITRDPEGTYVDERGKY